MEVDMSLVIETRKVPTPSHRRLRVFAFDPILSRQIETHEINEVTIKLPWDKEIEEGPTDDYIEVIDYDPASNRFYTPVNLNLAEILAQDGLPPSESNPQFHQQMVFAVARTTIEYFERALGRPILWASRIVDDNGGIRDEYVQRLRIYPHALREANAYYSPGKKALLFGYFPASITDSGFNMPGETVFTCLSHDIIAHETTHAILDSIHRRFIEPTNVDVWALHEGFSDIVALFQHFSYPEVLYDQIAKTRGELDKQNLLGQLAYQFGQAIGRYGALRSAIGRVDPETQEWIPEKPDPTKILNTTEPHERGAILVAAVFDAFLIIYKRRIADLLRIATGGSGLLPPGEIHPDLVKRLAAEASKTARHILNMCIRAMDYCPPVDVDFGDYLRALITADADLVKDDPYHYRLAVIEAFRRRGIYPSGINNLTEENLLWHKPDEEEKKAFKQVFRSSSALRKLVPNWWVTDNREEIFKQAQKSQAIVHSWFAKEGAAAAAKAAHLVFDPDAKEAFYRDGETGVPKFEVHSVRPARRIAPNGKARTDLVIEITQRRKGYLDPDTQKEADSGEDISAQPDFIFRGGCTLLVDPDTAEVRYCIYARIRSNNRLKRMRRFLTGEDSESARSTFYGDQRQGFFSSAVTRQESSEKDSLIEPFALLHNSFDNQEDL
jgi:hypothetical protein